MFCNSCRTLYSTMQKSLVVLNYCKLLVTASFCIVFSTDEALALLESSSDLIVIFCSKDSEWGGKCETIPKISAQTFSTTRFFSDI